MSWKEKMKEFGGGDLAFLSMDGEVINFIVVGDPELLEGRFKGRPSEKIGCPIITEDGFVLFVAGKRLSRKISKHEGHFDERVLQAIRHGVENEITASYGLTVIDDNELLQRLLAIKETEFRPEMINEAREAALEVMKQ